MNALDHVDKLEALAPDELEALAELAELLEDRIIFDPQFLVFSRQPADGEKRYIFVDDDNADSWARIAVRR